ncbi:MAG: hypothetical protein DRO99_01535 [Candidatus Aenigmatarchaeota archaeon]|nr:MAG: hypothetical protein DRO99_01535 [Candidatus Aenigmarchaeota archaeon]
MTLNRFLKEKRPGISKLAESADCTEKETEDGTKPAGTAEEREAKTPARQEKMHVKPAPFRSLIKSMTFSNSRLDCFEQCPFKFKLKYIDKIKPEIGKGIEAYMGTVVHATLEKLYKDMLYQKLNSLEDLITYYKEQWESNWDDNIVIVKEEYTPENYRKMGEEYIRTYYERFKPFDQDKTLGLEVRIDVNIGPNGEYTVMGYIDRLSQPEEGVYEIHDYKTSIKPKTQDELEADRQLALYALAIRQKYPDAKKVRQVWHFLAQDKHMVVEKGVDDLKKLEEETVRLIKKIEEESEFPHKGSALCGWCEYRDRCPDFKHEHKLSKMEPNEFLNEPGVKLVDRYAELMAEKKKAEDELKARFDTELEKIKQAMMKLAEKEGLRVIMGSENRATLWSKECYRFPGRKDPGREDLEKIIRQAGLWDEVSSLDTFSLSKLLDNPPPDWPTPIVEAIRAMATKERLERVYLSDKK